MEKFLELINLCKKRKCNTRLSDRIFSVHDDQKIMELSEELEVTGIYDKDQKIEVQLSNLNSLLLLDNHPKKTVEEDSPDSAYIWAHYSTEINGITFFKLESELKEEHKKAQAI